MTSLFQKIEAEPDLSFTHFVLRQKAKNLYHPHFDAFWLWNDVPTHLPTLDFVWGKLFSEYHSERDLEKILCPVLFLVGEFDFVAGPPSSWDFIATNLSSREIRIFEKSGHYPMVEQPEDFINKLVIW